MKKTTLNTVEDSDNKQTVIANQNEKINDSARRISDADDDEDETDDDDDDEETEYDIDEDSEELFEAVADECGCDSDEARAIVAVARMKHDNFDNISNYSLNDDIVSVGSDDYKVIMGYYDFEGYAIESVKNSLEDMGLEALADFAQQEAVDNPEYCNFPWESEMHEQNIGYAGDIASEEGSDGYKNRLIEEAVERGIISDDDLDEDGDYNGGDYDSLVEDFADDMDSDYSTCSEWLEGMYGSHWGREVSDWFTNWIDWDAVAEWCVRTDGASSHVDVYATEEIDGEDYYIIEY